MRPFFFTICLVLVCGRYSAQQDSVDAGDGKRNPAIYKGPRTASILSAVLPGAGQVYNRKYWKVPIIYGGLGGFGYFFYVHNSDYNYYRRNLAAIYDGDSSTENETPYSGDQLITLKKDAKKFRDIFLVGTVAVYLLNIVDANVDAHLRTFDVSDDLSLHLDPALWPAPERGFACGIQLKLKIH